MRHTMMLIPLLVLLTACPVRTVPDLPCEPCRMRCDQDFGDSCDDCQAEDCPDMADE